ncbi:MAG: four helix bundle protein [Waddliaceae bacterium]|jgi:four helix bundle protein|nr:four helix bundle protein [Waddliaceae bacterium]MBT3578428.1 four helix bundle protein [Waddliaceae bacterium]MBT4445121.1 four helix bundle protein [Waddliaceae bacterium]MBT6929122.1 four helix bundle protein [Waddliaceae bacterium]MBT7264621.1 four helix bundle protein [Waddliaceae bacterium]
MDFNFENLDVYKKAVDFVSHIYLLTKSFPKNEVFGLTSQLRRAAVSISLNIAEGSARTKKDFSRFIDMSRGSIFECTTVLQIALQQNYIKKNTFKQCKEYLIEMSKMLNGLKRSIK